MSDARFLFDSLPSAAQGLMTLLEHARNNSDVDFRFGPTAAPSILESGLWMSGDIDALADSLNKIPGCVQYPE